MELIGKVIIGLRGMNGNQGDRDVMAAATNYIKLSECSSRETGSVRKRHRSGRINTSPVLLEGSRSEKMAAVINGLEAGMKNGTESVKADGSFLVQ